MGPTQNCQSGKGDGDDKENSVIIDISDEVKDSKDIKLSSSSSSRSESKAKDKPLPLNPTVMESVFNNYNQQQSKKMMTDEEAFLLGTSSKNMR